MKSELERLTTVEVQLTDLQKTVDEIRRDVKDIKESITTSYVTVEDYKEHLRNCQSGKYLQWIQLAVTAILTSAITFLVIEFFKSH